MAETSSTKKKTQSEIFMRIKQPAKSRKVPKATRTKRAKKKLWSLISEYIRRKKADSNGYVKCSTCETVKHWREMQAGHWIPQAQGDSIRFELSNINVQCYRCNVNLGGNGPEYYEFMLIEYGQEEMDRLKQRQREIIKFYESDYLDMIEDIEAKLKQLKQE